MPSPHPYLSSLEDLARREATGEFIAVANEMEVHVFFQSGRVAWGTSSVNRFAFSRHLFEHCNVDKETFKELVEACREENKPLGETLVEWNLVTQEDVRDALASQLVETLRSLTELDNAQTLFLPRASFSDYDAALTFAVTDMFDKVGYVKPAAEAVEKTAGGQRAVQSMFESFKANVPDALWMELLGPGLSRSFPDSYGGNVGSALAPIFLDGDTDFVAIRTLAGAVLGGTIPGEGESLWTGLGKNAIIGNAFSALAPVLSANLSAINAPSRYAQAPWTVASDNSEIVDRVLAAIDQTNEVLAAFSLNDAGELQWACARETVPLPELTRKAERWSTALVLADIDRAIEPSRPPESSMLLYDCRSLVVAGTDMWTYGRGHVSGGRGGLWLCIDRSTSQGLGWAILTSLARLVCTNESAP